MVDDMVGVDHPLRVVDLDAAAADAIAELAALPTVIVGVGAPEAPAAAFADVVLAPDDPALARLDAKVREAPRAAIALALLLRGANGRSIGDGLVAESAVYSMLQAGPEFAAWRAAHPVHDRGDTAARVRVEREDGVLRVTLTRAAVHNALDRQMRDELYAAFTVAASDPDLRVVLRGEGPSFCAGGDLDEFGSRPDPATAHVIRLQRSVGRLIATMADRVEAVLHGACVGSGIELPAFAGRVVARPDTRIGLPELELGLVPGAGGTVSVTRRIGRHRTAYLALSGDVIDAATALDWGLVDAVTEETP